MRPASTRAKRATAAPYSAPTSAPAVVIPETESDTDADSIVSDDGADRSDYERDSTFADVRGVYATVHLVLATRRLLRKALDDLCASDDRMEALLRTVPPLPETMAGVPVKHLILRYNAWARAVARVAHRARVATSDFYVTTVTATNAALDYAGGKPEPLEQLLAGVDK